MPSTQPHPLPHLQAALTWFNAEHRNLLAAQLTAATHSWHETIWQLARSMTVFLAGQGHRHHWLAVWQRALATAEHLPNPTTRTLIHGSLGRVYTELKRHSEAVEHLHHALDLAEQHDNLHDQAYVHGNLAWAWEAHGDNRKALEHATRCLQLRRVDGDPLREAHARNTVGWCLARLGDHELAREHGEAALSLYRHHNDKQGEALARGILAYSAHHTGHYRDAIRHCEHVAALLRDIGNIYKAIEAIDGIGLSYAALGEHEQARTAWQEAFDLYRQHGRNDRADLVQQQLDALDKQDGT